MKHTGLSLHELKTGLNKFPQVLINVQVSNPVDPNENLAFKSITSITDELGSSGRVLFATLGQNHLFA